MNHEKPRPRSENNRQHESQPELDAASLCRVDAPVAWPVELLLAATDTHGKARGPRSEFELALESVLVDSQLCQAYAAAQLERIRARGGRDDIEMNLADYDRAIHEGLSTLSDDAMYQFAQSPLLLVLAHERILNRPEGAWPSVLARMRPSTR